MNDWTLSDQIEEDASMVEEMITWPQFSDQPWARMALRIAARAIRRRRHLTDAEKLENIRLFLAEEI